MCRVSFPGIGAKLLASWKGRVVGEVAGGSAWLCFEVLHTVPVKALVGGQELNVSVRVGAPSEAVDSSGTLERESGVKVEAGDTLLVGALVSEGAPKHENKGREGWECKKCLTGALIKWIINGALEGGGGGCAWTAKT